MIARDNQAGGDNFVIRFPLSLAEVERGVVRKNIRKDERLVGVVADAVEIDVGWTEFQRARPGFGKIWRDKDALASFNEPVHIGNTSFERGFVRCLFPRVVMSVTGDRLKAGSREYYDSD